MVTQLEIRLRRGRDGPDNLTLTRDDGTSTWQRLPAGQAQHDLTHYAVETCLGLTHGFYGLVAAGRNISDFEDRETRGSTEEAILTEFLVNQVLLEHATGQFADVGEFNNVMLTTLRNHGDGDLARAHRPLTAQELEAVRVNARELWREWRRTDPGADMTLTFEVSPD